MFAACFPLAAALYALVGLRGVQVKIKDCNLGELFWSGARLDLWASALDLTVIGLVSWFWAIKLRTADGILSAGMWRHSC